MPLTTLEPLFGYRQNDGTILGRRWSSGTKHTQTESDRRHIDRRVNQGDAKHMG
jgi:hypothetical protein